MPDHQLYESYFQLEARPFAAAPRPDRYFPARSIDQARQTLARVIERSEGIGLAIGATGTGKSLLCQVLGESLKTQFGVACLLSGRLASRRALLQAILFELGLRYRGMDEAELRLSLIDFLTSSKRSFSALALIVDEAHTLPAKLLEELRLIGNLAQDGEPRIRVVLVGAPSLEEHLTSPKLDSFNQRIAARCYLSNLNHDETVAFIWHQLAAVGGDADAVITTDAMSAIHRASDGIPRLVNQISDHALIVGHLAGVKPITDAIVEEAWADLQQLPAPWDGQSNDARQGQAAIVEFGRLDDDGEAVESIPFRAAVADFDVSADPVEQLDEIVDQLAEIDDFHPAGSIRPEVELVFPELRSPLDESYAEEELIVDRYSSLERSVFRELPRVTSAEGRELSAMLDNHQRAAIRSGQVAAESTAKRERADAFGDANPPRGGEAALHDVVFLSDPSPVVGPELTIEVDDQGDADVLVIEDDLPEPRKPRSSPLVRRQEYRQLFTRLRRG
jgi:type II secretory pathway predicted ATPase ExeA